MKRKRPGRDECTANEFIAYLREKERNPTVALDRVTLERRTAVWHSEWQKAALSRLQSSGDIFQHPKRVVRFRPGGGPITRSLIIFDKPTGEFIEFKPKGVSFFNKLSLAGIDDAVIDLEAENWARSKVSGRLLKSSGEIVTRRLKS